MDNHNGVLMMQRALLAGTLGLAMARKAAAILEGEPVQSARPVPEPDRARAWPAAPDGAEPDGAAPDGAGPWAGDTQEPVAPGVPRTQEGAVLRAILDAANECLGHFDDRPAGERWCDTLFHLLDLAAFAGEFSAG